MVAAGVVLLLLLLLLTGGERKKRRIDERKKKMDRSYGWRRELSGLISSHNYPETRSTYTHTHTDWYTLIVATHTKRKKEKSNHHLIRTHFLECFFRKSLLHKSSWRLGPRNDNVFIVSYKKNKSRKKRHPAVGWCQAFGDNDDNQNDTVWGAAVWLLVGKAE